MRNRGTFPNGYKCELRDMALRRGMTYEDLIREIKREHKHLKYLAMPEHFNAIDKKWRDSHPESLHQLYAARWADDKDNEYRRTQEWFAKHPEKVKEYSDRQRRKNPEKTRQKKREEYQRHADKYILRSCIWSKKNPDKKLGYEHARRAWKMAAGYEDCSEKIAMLRKEQFCRWCCCQLTTRNWSIDHVIPLKRGGRHCPDNLVAACKSCNCSKNDKLVSEWLPLATLKEVA